MAYLQDLTDPEFVVFSDDVAVDLENSYPVYTTFMQMDGVDDTVRMFVVTTIVEELDADARNMRHLYPYRYLVSQGMLPDGLTHDQQTEFYKCLAQKVNGHYSTMNQFFNAILADTTTTRSSRSSSASAPTTCSTGSWRWKRWRSPRSNPTIRRIDHNITFFLTEKDRPVCGSDPFQFCFAALRPRAHTYRYSSRNPCSHHPHAAMAHLELQRSTAQQLAVDLDRNLGRRLDTDIACRDSDRHGLSYRCCR